jgi:glucose/mannose-6-phosphate isomerase
MIAHINFNKIDGSNMLQLLTAFPQQFRQARQIGETFDLKIDHHNVKNIVFAGMGGSAIGGDLIISCLHPELKIPAFVNRNYFLPNFVNQSSLVVVSSFSGNTEESLSCYENAKVKGAQIVCISSGGKLGNQANQDNIPLITIPGGTPPRTALGYLSIPLLVLLSRSGFAKVADDDFDETEKLLDQKLVLFAPEATENTALNLANQLKSKIPILYSSADFLSIVGLRWKGQFSENAKVLAFCSVFPELNHNEIVGWERLPNILTNFQIIYFRDRDDNNRNQIRMQITQGILEKVTSPIIELFAEGNSRLARLFSLIYLGDWVSFYLAVINGIDPTKIEKIQILKNRLSAEHELL